MNSKRNQNSYTLKKNTPSWMQLCNKMNNSDVNISQIRKKAREEGIDTKGKNRKQLCKELAKKYQSNLEIENSQSKKLKNKENIDKLKVKLAKLIDNYEGGYRNYFEPQDIDNWNEGKTIYEYHEVLYNIKTFDVIKKNKSKLKELFDYQNFPSFQELMILLINSIEKIPVEDRQRYVMSLRAIFMTDPTEDTRPEKEEEEKLFEYDYEDEYGVLR